MEKLETFLIFCLKSSTEIFAEKKSCRIFRSEIGRSTTRGTLCIIEYFISTRIARGGHSTKKDCFPKRFPKRLSCSPAYRPKIYSANRKGEHVRFFDLNRFNVLHHYCRPRKDILHSKIMAARRRQKYVTEERLST